MTTDINFFDQIIEECNKCVDEFYTTDTARLRVNVMFGKIMYGTTTNKCGYVNAIQFRDLKLSVLVTNQTIMGIIHEDGTIRQAVSNPRTVLVEQALNKLFALLEDTIEKSIEELTDGNFQYFDV